ncbi:alpha/beta fold hydrolase [Fodinicurvata sediminis]|uniref:alpha/beta fold hydrolase n=1 Tax=Fodinicurvata sediminis TaxID=1121832 RepID=UPI0003B7AD9C|nr:alpha/beta hydrolase [Fodinicurvata sediminis]
MARIHVNGVDLFYDFSGNVGEAVALVHGSWASHRDWEFVAPELSKSHRVLTYDRRGHSQSERPPGQGSIREDVNDLAILIEELGLPPAWVVGNSLGASIALRLAAERPDLLRGVVAHEPPLFSLLSEDPAQRPMLQEIEHQLGIVASYIDAGEHARAAERFMDEVIFGPGAWEHMPQEVRDEMTENAPSFLDEFNDREMMAIDIEALQQQRLPILLTTGGQSPPLFAPVIDALAAIIPEMEVYCFEQAGHIPHVTHPEPYIDATRRFIGTAQV